MQKQDYKLGGGKLSEKRTKRIGRTKELEGVNLMLYDKR